tara:strand:+ start:396 stop:1061 length:666 start_codon:yes stop_codon:yes gene_type:complete
MIINHHRKFIFFKPMKTAGSSVELSLESFCSADDILTGDSADGDFHPHTSPETLFLKTGKTWQDYLKVSICRNPWDMTVSYYWWCMKRNSDSILIIKNQDIDALVHEKFRLFLETESLFDLDIDKLSEPFYEKPIDWFSKVSLSFVSDKIDRYLRFENIQSDYDSLCKDLSLESSTLPRLKSDTRKINRHYSKYYSDYTKKVIEEKFSNYIDRFEYCFLQK